MREGQSQWLVHAYEREEYSTGTCVSASTTVCNRFQRANLNITVCMRIIITRCWRLLRCRHMRITINSVWYCVYLFVRFYFHNYTIYNPIFMRSARYAWDRSVLTFFKTENVFKTKSYKRNTYYRLSMREYVLSNSMVNYNIIIYRGCGV